MFCPSMLLPKAALPVPVKAKNNEDTVNIKYKISNANQRVQLQPEQERCPLD